MNDNLTSIEYVLFSLARTVEAKDQYTQGHVERVSKLAIILGLKMGLSEGDLEALRFGGVFHDIGKITHSSNPHVEHLKGIEDYVKSATDLTKQLLGLPIRTDLPLNSPSSPGSKVI